MSTATLASPAPASWPAPASVPRRQRILVVTDFAGAANAAWEVALRLARSADAELDLVHVLGGFDEIFRRKNREVIRFSDALAACLGEARAWGVEAQTTSLIGAPGVEIVRHAQRTQPDLVLFGSAGPHDDRVAAIVRHVAEWLPGLAMLVATPA